MAFKGRVFGRINCTDVCVCVCVCVVSSLFLYVELSIQLNFHLRQINNKCSEF